LNHSLPSLKAIKQELAKRDYGSYVEYVYGHVGYKHATHTLYISDVIQKAIQKKQDMMNGLIPMENQYIALNMPPRHSKSMTITETLPSYYLGKFPLHRVIEISYGQDFAKKFGKKNKEKIDQFGDELFNIQLSTSSSAVDDFYLSNEVGGMISRGALSGVTGQGADLMIIDDPIKTREEANSEVYRNKLWDEWVDSFSTRLHPGAIVILILTRWHEDDLQGRLLNPEYGEPLPWNVINLPLEAEENDLLGRTPGTPLWPERYGHKFIEDRKKYPSSFNALYQGRPTAAEGNILKKHWWKYYDKLPQLARILISVDATFKDGEDSDYVVIQSWGKVGADIYLLDQIREKMDFPETLRAIESMKNRYNRATIIVEDKANGSAIVSMLRRKISGVIPINPQGGKVARVNAVSDHIESGHVYLPSNVSWLTTFLDEASAFPNGKNDDQVDAMSQALNRFIYHYAELDKESDPDNPTPQEKHEKMVRQLTGKKPRIKSITKW
jgi:predicted phage terminase large subunit-like protein